MGSSGVGKTTLLNMLMGEDLPNGAGAREGLAWATYHDRRQLITLDRGDTHRHSGIRELSGIDLGAVWK